MPGASSLHVVHDRPAHEPLGAVLVVHGYAEHKGRYQTLCDALTQRGVTTLRVDLPGHGQAPGPRARIDDAEALVAALAEVAQEARAYGPVAVFGHSMGGALALRLAQSAAAPEAGATVTAPFLRNAAPPPAWLLRLATAASHLLPALRTTTLKASDVSRDPSEVAAYQHDPLVDRGGVPLASFRELHALGPRVLADAGALHGPVRIVHGDSDAIADVAGSRDLVRAAQAAGRDVQLHEVRGAYHDLLHDVGGEVVRQRIADGLTERIRAVSDRVPA